MPIKISLLTGSVKKSQRTILHEGLENGETHILIGTHALIEDKVKFKNLGFVVIDEQHRFGVAQRAKMWLKIVNPTCVSDDSYSDSKNISYDLYGDLDVSIIDELPPVEKS